MRILRALSAVLLTFGAAACAARSQAPPSAAAAGARLRFDFGAGRVAPGYRKVPATMAYSREAGFGFDLGSTPRCVDRGGPDLLRADFCTGDAPVSFSVALPEGNYRVTVTLGDREGASETTVRAESRRLMLESVATGWGEFVTRTFVVNIRDSRLASGGQVALKSREQGVLHWDDKLTLEFSGPRPAVCAVEIAPAPDVVTVYLAGDSTVTDQTQEPYSAWGQMLPRFFSSGVAVANHAESGESLRSFIAERRLEKIFERTKAGDYLFVQFAHNDQKQGAQYTASYAAAATTYADLLAGVVGEVRSRGAVPVLVTSMHRRRFDENGRVVNTLEDYPEAMRRVARETRVTCIDLNAMSRGLFEALGPDGTLRAFVHYPAGAFPGQPDELKDDTHFNPYGAYELARSVVEAIRTSGLTLARQLSPDVTPFDPSHPDPFQVTGVRLGAVPPAPREWMEATGHRVVRLSDEPGSASLYFHQNAFTAGGDKLLITTPRGLSTLDFRTRDIVPVVDGVVSHVVVGPKSRQVFYIKDDAVCATHLDTRVSRVIVRNTILRSGSGLAVNATETLLGGSYVEEGVPPREGGLEARWAARLPMALYTIDIRSGALHIVYRSTDWLNHVQFSPSDPTLLMFCHEGPWHKVDRIWTIRTDGKDLRKIHTRTMDMEIAGHEFFSHDGRIIWYDLQTPKSVVFSLAGVVLSSGETIRYPVAREDWSVHFNVSPDGSRFAGDGGGPNSVAAPGNGQWIYLFTPQGGVLQVEKLVDLGRHDYHLEPNVSFTPDGRWVVFRSNMHGTSHVYAVEVEKRR